MLDEEARALYSINLIVEKNKETASKVTTQDMTLSEINKAFGLPLDYNIKSDSGLKEFDKHRNNYLDLQVSEKDLQASKNKANKIEI